MIRDRATLAVVVLLLVLGGVFLWVNQRDRAQLAMDLADSQTQQEELASGVERLSGQVEALGGEPAVDVERTADDGPELIEGPRGPRGERGEPGPAPSDEQVAAAVERYCADNGCVGPQGPAPTASQVAAAVAAYCDDRGQCRGPTGPEGADGADGETGPQGPGPTGEQIAAAVESYCAAHNGCRGPAGEDGEDSTVPGPQGPPGEPGPTCPDGADPIEWAVTQPQAAVIGLDPGTYLVCRSTQEEP